MRARLRFKLFYAYGHEPRIADTDQETALAFLEASKHQVLLEGLGDMLAARTNDSGVVAVQAWPFAGCRMS